VGKLISTQFFGRDWNQATIFLTVYYYEFVETSVTWNHHFHAIIFNGKTFLFYIFMFVGCRMCGYGTEKKLGFGCG
jgi:hypothetical protein